MNIHTLLLLCSLSTAIAIPFDPDYQLEDPNPPINFQANDPFYEAGIPDPLGLNQYISPGSARPNSPDPLGLNQYTSPGSTSPNSPQPPASHPQQNDAEKPPVVESTGGEDFCCEPKSGAEKRVCHKLVSGICFPGELYNCPNGYKEDLNGCTKLDMDARKEPSWPNPMNFVWLAGICFRKPKPPMCPDFFNNLPGF